MGLKVYNIDFFELSREKSIRCDFNFISFQNNYSIIEYYSFDDLFDIIVNDKVDFQTLFEKDFYYVEISNVSKESDVFPIKLNFHDRTYESENYYKKIEKGDIINVSKNDILISKVRPNLKKYILIDEIYDRYYYTSAFIHIKPKILNKIFFYLFKTSFYKNLISISRQGKGYPTLKEDDFHYLKFPKKDIDILVNNESYIFSLIEPIENKIKSLKETIIPEQKIINEVFANKFNFDLRELETANKPFYIDLNTIDTPLLRMTTIQNKPLSIKLKNIMRNNSIFLKSILTKRIIRGKQPIYEDDGIKVIKTMNIQKGNIIFDDVQFVSEDFFNLNKDRAICKNDLLLTSTGMGRGKFAIYKYDEPCFADSHISIIRFDTNKMIPSYLNYFCQSFFGSMQLKYIEMHIKGTPEIYEAQLNYFCIFNLDVNKQQEIVDEIDNKIKEQQKINIQIEKERNKIYDIINSYIN